MCDKYKGVKQTILVSLSSWEIKMSHLFCNLVLAISLFGLSSLRAEPAQANPKVKLILQITVDGLRGDLLRRYGARFGSGGFRYLLETGTVFASAHYQHANTETIVGHATLATGAFPAQHGMVGNVWFDRQTGELSYNIEDPNHPLLPSRKQQAKAVQLDPSQNASRSKGRSPVSILASTFSDELAIFTAGKSKVFAVAGKDRSAVSMAGHAGKAFWFSTDNGDYITSSFYYNAYPEWVVKWNGQRLAAGHASTSWELLKPQESYLLGAFDDRPYETDLKGYGRTFPHPFGPADSKLFNTLLFVSPVGDQLTANFAKAVITNESLGKGDVPDYLAVGFSSVDAVNHFFGPSSLENEDAVLQLDRTLASLLEHVEKSVGLRNTLIVLSADHGMAEMPETLAEKGMATGRIHTEDVIRIANEEALRLFGIKDAVKTFFRPYLYFNEDVIKNAQLDVSVVADAIATALTSVEGIARAVPSSALKTMQDTPLLRQIRNNFHPSRSGDIYVVQEPYWFLFDKGPIAVMHGSPWRYDTYVPIIFAGPGVAAANVYRTVHPTDVAPTLSAYLGLKPPSSAVGAPLREVLQQQ
jgi:predicted AlkP superfamily pyrophosphatase or phosphodiesterase